MLECKIFCTNKGHKKHDILAHCNYISPLRNSKTSGSTAGRPSLSKTIPEYNIFKRIPNLEQFIWSLCISKINNVCVLSSRSWSLWKLDRCIILTVYKTIRNTDELFQLWSTYSSKSVNLNIYGLQFTHNVRFSNGQHSLLMLQTGNRPCAAPHIFCTQPSPENMSVALHLQKSIFFVAQ